MAGGLLASSRSSTAARSSSASSSTAPFSLTRERERQIEAAALLKLRDPKLSDRLSSFVEPRQPRGTRRGRSAVAEEQGVA